MSLGHTHALRHTDAIQIAPRTRLPAENTGDAFALVSGQISQTAKTDPVGV